VILFVVIVAFFLLFLFPRFFKEFGMGKSSTPCEFLLLSFYSPPLFHVLVCTLLKSFLLSSSVARWLA
jgi:hypothetical protein